jgi:hypothetical protein
LSVVAEASDTLPEVVAESIKESIPASFDTVLTQAPSRLPLVDTEVARTAFAPEPVVVAEAVVEPAVESIAEAMPDALPEPPPAPKPDVAPARTLVEQFAQRIAEPAVAPVFVAPPAPAAAEPISLPEGMVMIETRPDRAPSAPAIDEPLAPEPQRRPRARPAAPVVVPDEPLQQVETRK